ncbi:uncharacterized protein L203_103068 [Cryptococcus depauperatus CBS 7841]|uniref:SWIM-type domain-containing protein n=1 Tax=Cryptococcus depauperatus CBS 7841 TaxID=1295531 RepID=A0AAJ8M1N9_9TREE
MAPSPAFMLLAATLLDALPASLPVDDALLLQLHIVFGPMLMSALQIVDRREVVRVELPNGRHVASSSGKPYALYIDPPIPTSINTTSTDQPAKAPLEAELQAKSPSADTETLPDPFASCSTAQRARLSSTQTLPFEEEEQQRLERIQKMAIDLGRMYCPCTGFALNSLSGGRTVLCKHLLSVIVARRNATASSLVFKSIMPDKGPSPALSNRSLASSADSFPQEEFHVHLPSHLNYNRTLETALSHLVAHLVEPLSEAYSADCVNSLLSRLKEELLAKFAPTWDELHPQVGSGTRSLICTRYYGLPPPMRTACGKAGVEERVWRKAIAKAGGRENRLDKGQEWEVWCDPGQVVWRWGGWEWEDPGFEPTKVVREPLQVIWQAATDGEKHSPATPVKMAQPATNGTPSRPSYAIPIRAPTVLAIPPTPAHGQGLNEARLTTTNVLLPAFSNIGLGYAPGKGQRSQQPSGWTSSDYASSRSTSLSFSETDEQCLPDRRPSSRCSHRGSESQSSVTSSVSDSNSGHTQLLTPSSRPATADPFKVPISPIKELYKEHDVKCQENNLEKEPKPKTTPINVRGRNMSPAALGESVAQPTTPTTESTITPRVPSPSVTPYDGGNVTVLGGGVKLGGSGQSRASSTHSNQRTPIDRSRSPSISVASRALNTALGPNGETRKQRTRRRIMPTYLGHLGQSGVGGPVMGAFQYGGNISPGGMGYGFAQQHVGVGVAPPAIGIRGPMPRMGH